MKSELEIKDKGKENEGIKIAPFRQHIRKTSPHKHKNYFEIIYLSQGSGSHTIDTNEYEIKPPVIFTIRKEQVHFWDIKSEPMGFVLIIKKSFIENCLEPEIKRLISDLSSHNCLFPKDNSAMEIYHILQAEYSGRKKSNPLIMDGLLKALLAKTLESVAPNAVKNGNNSTFQRFIDLLNKENQLINKVGYYADLLNTTPQNLNAICQKETGQSASEILSQYIINEIKRLLIYTDFNINEISSQLDFKDNSHFSKYFKRFVGLTPSQYRAQNE
ncbi:AraC family transcriptional regulator [Brumimicrobium mesophilum]|uniref:AraC family transcriptional regulator n=1 Tax=Brumimicrobium mesophilum TaxID=392717 RepID=UPI000D13F28E|nr:helix-turn-helix domain-containing protein [Brumimicrobium mesophilum]